MPPRRRGPSNNQQPHHAPEGSPFPYPGVHVFPSPHNPPLPGFPIGAPPGSARFPCPGAVPQLPAATPCTPNMINWIVAANNMASYSSPQASPIGVLIAPPGHSIVGASSNGPHGMIPPPFPSPAAPPPRRGTPGNHPSHRPPEVYPYSVPDPRSFPLCQNPQANVCITSARQGLAWFPGPGAAPQLPRATRRTPNMRNWNAVEDSGASYALPQGSPSGVLLAPPSPSDGVSSNNGRRPPSSPASTPSPIRGIFSNHPQHRSPEAYPYPVPDHQFFPLSSNPPVPIYTPHTHLGSVWFPGPGAAPTVPAGASGTPNMEKGKTTAVDGIPCFPSPRTTPRETLTAPPSPSVEGSSTGRRGTNSAPLCSPLLSPSKFTTPLPSPSMEISSTEQHDTGSGSPCLGRMAVDVAEQGCMTVFNSHALYRATEDFSPDRLLLSATNGIAVYSGELRSCLRRWNSCSIVVWKLDMNPLQCREYFKQQAEILNELVHPNILPLIGVCHDPLCYVYPRISCNVRDKLATLENRAAFPWKARIRVALDVAAGLGYLHAQSLFHLDVTLGHIHIDANGIAHLANFDLVRQLDNFTNLADLPGTAGFLDLTYSVSNPPTAALDIFSLGRVITCLLKGILNPLEASTVVDRAGRCNFVDDSVDEHAKWPHEQALQTAHLITRCCHRDRNERPDSQRVVQILSQLLGD